MNRTGRHREACGLGRYAHPGASSIHAYGHLLDARDLFLFKRSKLVATGLHKMLKFANGMGGGLAVFYTYDQLEWKI